MINLFSNLVAESLPSRHEGGDDELAVAVASILELGLDLPTSVRTEEQKSLPSLGQKEPLLALGRTLHSRKRGDALITSFVEVNEFALMFFILREGPRHGS